MSKIEELIKKYCYNGVEYKTLGEIFDLYKGMTGVSAKWAEQGNCVFIDYLNAYNNLKIDVSLLKNATVKNLKQNIVEKGDILLTCASETPNECAMSSVVEGDIQGDVFLDDHLFGLKLKSEYSDKLNTTFVNYYFRASEFRTSVNKAVRGVTRFYICNADFLKLSIPVPPLPVQEEIVRILDNFTTLEAELEAELEARRKQYEYYRDKLLSFNNLNWGGQIVEWKKLGEVCEKIASGKNKERLQDGKYPVYGSTGIIATTNYAVYHQTQLLVARVGANAGFVHIAQGNYDITDNTLYLNIKSEYCLRYVYYILVISNLHQYVKGGGQPLITAGQLKEISIPIPSLPEQERIVSILDRFDTLVNDISQGLPAEIAARRKQYEYYRDKLLTFKRKEA